MILFFSQLLQIFVLVNSIRFTKNNIYIIFSYLIMLKHLYLKLKQKTPNIYLIVNIVILPLMYVTLSKIYRSLIKKLVIKHLINSLFSSMNINMINLNNINNYLFKLLLKFKIILRQSKDKKNIGYGNKYQRSYLLYNRGDRSLLLNGSVTRLYKPICNIVPHRTMFKTAGKLSPQVLLERQAILKNKAVFLRYCEHFKNKNMAQLLNDHTFIQIMDDAIHKEPTLYSRAFQLAFEVTYSKRRFSQETLQKYYENDFKIEDNFNVNAGVCDQSTVYTCTLTKYLTNHFNFDTNDVIVNSTPIFLTKDKITDTIKQKMEHSKKMTDNSVSDCSIKERPFDFKSTDILSFSKNHIYIMDLNYLIKNSTRIFNNLKASLENSLIKSELSGDCITYTKIMLNVIKNHQDLNPQECLEKINMFITKSNVPKDFKFPIIFIKEKACINSLIKPENIEELSKVPLNHGHLDSVKAKKAIMGILENFDSKIKENITEVTHNSILFTKHNTDID